MHFANLQLIAQAKGLSASDLARCARVSRQAVSHWAKRAREQGGIVDVKSTHLQRLCAALKIAPRYLLRPLPAYSEAERALISARYLWDRLYPDEATFVLALGGQESKAVARLVDRDGLYFSAAVVGQVVWERFHSYKKYLPPARRVELERLWTFRQNRAAH